MQRRWVRATCLAVVGACGCAQVRLEQREPPVPAEVEARIARLGCGDAAAGDSVAKAHAPRDSTVVVRGRAECAELLGWMARWMGETFATWLPEAPRGTDDVARFALLRAGPRLRVYVWFAAPPPGAERIGAGMVYDIDLRQRGAGITGFSF